MTDEQASAAVPAEAAGVEPSEVGAEGGSGTPAPDPAPDEETLPTLQEEFAELTPQLQRSMFGKPAQLVTGLLIGALLLVALLIGLTTLSRQGAAPGPAGPAPTVSATR